MPPAPALTLKTVGMLGGMSPESTLLYYRLINQEVRTLLPGTGHSCPILLNSLDFAEISHLQAVGEWDQLAKVLSKAAWNLREAGAEVIAIACNTMHVVAEQIQDATGLEILHLVDMTAETILKAGRRKPALLGTAYTMQMDFLKGRLLNKYGIEVLVSDSSGVNIVHNIIYSELCHGIVRPESKALLMGVVNNLIEGGADCLILGCTELIMILASDDISVSVFDTMEIHAKGIAQWVVHNAMPITKDGKPKLDSMLNGD